VEEYLALEETASRRHEYVVGEVYAMTGATKRHNRIAGNVYAALLSAARGGPCRVYVETVKLRVADDVFYYPDVMVACEPEGENPVFEEEPCLVVEVLSQSTESTDRREKLAAYKRLPSLRAYLIVSQEQRRVERCFRDEEGRWGWATLSDEGSFTLSCPEARLSLGDIYEGL
jgi:Uma2 family endonuclease